MHANGEWLGYVFLTHCTIASHASILGGRNMTQNGLRDTVIPVSACGGMLGFVSGSPAHEEGGQDQGRAPGEGGVVDGQGVAVPPQSPTAPTPADRETRENTHENKTPPRGRKGGGIGFRPHLDPAINFRGDYLVVSARTKWSPPLIRGRHGQSQWRVLPGSPVDPLPNPPGHSIISHAPYATPLRHTDRCNLQNPPPTLCPNRYTNTLRSLFV
jgi:hypothetical protein